MDIVFTQHDAPLIHHPHHDALVLIAKISNSNVHRILMDNKNAVNILHFNTYRKMGFTKEYIKLVVTLMYEFIGESSSLWERFH